MNKNIKSGAGFTIIELIVVIAIIAILAAIVMVNVTQYITKSKDASIVQDMETLLPMSTQYIVDHGSYTGFCGEWESIRIKINKIVPKGAGGAACVVGTDGKTWAACAVLNSYVDGAPDENNNGYAWCVDNTGNKKSIKSLSCMSNIKSGSSLSCAGVE